MKNDWMLREQWQEKTVLEGCIKSQSGSIFCSDDVFKRAMGRSIRQKIFYGSCQKLNWCVRKLGNNFPEDLVIKHRVFHFPDLMMNICLLLDRQDGFKMGFSAFKSCIRQAALF